MSDKIIKTIAFDVVNGKVYEFEPKTRILARERAARVALKEERRKQRAVREQQEARARLVKMGLLKVGQQK